MAKKIKIGSLDEAMALGRADGAADVLMMLDDSGRQIVRESMDVVSGKTWWQRRSIAVDANIPERWQTTFREAYVAGAHAQASEILALWPRRRIRRSER